MTIKINNHIELLEFIKRDDISTVDAVTVFEKAVKVVCFIFVDAMTKELLIEKSEMIKELEAIISNPDYLPKPIIFLGKK
jgi:hypothetical protein